MNPTILIPKYIVILIIAIFGLSFYAIRKNLNSLKGKIKEISNKRKTPDKHLKSPAENTIKRKAVSNVAEGTHYGRITQIAEHKLRDHILVGFGSIDRAVILNQDHTLPMGVVAYGVDEGEYVSVELLGSSNSTILLQASTSIQRGTYVFTGTNGSIQALPTAPGKYFRIGTALNEAKQVGDLVEVDPSFPSEITIA